MDMDLLTAMKALSDASRLRIIGLLAEGNPLTVEDLARRLSLSPGTVVHHLKRLREAGLVDSKPRRPYVDYWLKVGRLSELGASLGRLAREQSGEEPAIEAPDWAGPDETRVLRTFFEGERLSSLPAQHSRRLIVLRHIAETTFERKHKYPEREVNQRLALRYPDVASLRRYLVDEGFMTRKQSVYKLRPRKDWPVVGGVPSEAQRSRASASAETADAPAS